MIDLNEKFGAAIQSNVLMLKRLNLRTFSNFEKWMELHLAFTKSMVGDVLQSVQSMAGLQDAQQLLALQTGLLHTFTEHLARYGQDAHILQTQANAEFFQAMDAITASRPIGAEVTVALLENAANLGQSAIKLAQTSAKNS
jgi:Phasin protein